MFWCFICYFRFTFTFVSFILPPIYSSHQRPSLYRAPSGTRLRHSTLRLRFRLVLHPHFFNSLFNFCLFFPLLHSTIHSPPHLLLNPQSARRKAWNAGADWIRSQVQIQPPIPLYILLDLASSVSFYCLPGSFSFPSCPTWFGFHASLF